MRSSQWWGGKPWSRQVSGVSRSRVLNSRFGTAVRARVTRRGPPRAGRFRRWPLLHRRLLREGAFRRRRRSPGKGAHGLGRRRFRHRALQGHRRGFVGRRDPGRQRVLWAYGGYRYGRGWGPCHHEMVRREPVRVTVVDQYPKPRDERVVRLHTSAQSVDPGKARVVHRHVMPHKIRRRRRRRDICGHLRHRRRQMERGVWQRRSRVGESADGRPHLSPGLFRPGGPVRRRGVRSGGGSRVRGRRSLNIMGGRGLGSGGGHRKEAGSSAPVHHLLERGFLLLFRVQLGLAPRAACRWGEPRRGLPGPTRSRRPGGLGRGSERGSPFKRVRGSSCLEVSGRGGSSGGARFACIAALFSPPLRGALLAAPAAALAALPAASACALGDRAFGAGWRAVPGVPVQRGVWVGDGGRGGTGACPSPTPIPAGRTGPASTMPCPTCHSCQFLAVARAARALSRHLRRACHSGIPAARSSRYPASSMSGRIAA